MARDRAVHQRLGEGRLVSLVVPVPTVAKQVDDHVFLEFFAEFGGDAGDFDDRFGIVAVYVKDRRLDAFCHIRRVGARPGGGRSGGKPDLVVDDDVDRAAGAEADQVRQFKRLGDEPLSGESRIAMHQNAGYLRPLGVATLQLLCPDLAEHDGIDGLEVRGICSQGQVDHSPTHFSVARSAEVVFDVARAMDVLGIGGIPLELGEDRGKRFADEICEHVETAPVRHADHELTDTELVAAVEDRLQRRHQRLGAFDAKPLGAGVAPVEKPLEGLPLGQCP